MKSQIEMWRDAERHSADLNAAFQELATHPTNPLTAADLSALIARRPEVYGRFSGFVAKLPLATCCLPHPAPACSPALLHG